MEGGVSCLGLLCNLCEKHIGPRTFNLNTLR